MSKPRSTTRPFPGPVSTSVSTAAAAGAARDGIAPARSICRVASSAVPPATTGRPARWCAAASTTSSELAPVGARPSPRRRAGGFFLFFSAGVASSGRWRRGGREGGNPGRELLEPGGEARMIRAPGSGKAEVAIGERAGERDLADIGRRGVGRRCGLGGGERARALAGLQLEPFLLVLLRRPVARLVVDQDRCIHQAVGERLQPQRREARLRFLGNDAAAAGQ